MRRSRGFGEHCSPPVERAPHACGALLRPGRKSGDSRLFAAGTGRTQ